MMYNNFMNDRDKKYQVMIAGCFDILAGKVIRLGHMGENANVPDVTLMLDEWKSILRF